MANWKSKQKSSSWQPPTFDDFDSSPSPPLEKKAVKRFREPDALSHLGKKTPKVGSALWVDVYSPTTRDDLAVHKRKVQEVESWLVESMAALKGRKFLLLTGPAGCGKSATVRLLAKEARLNFVEWINPTTTAYNSAFLELENAWIPEDTVRSASQTTQFWDFLMRASKYRSVCGTGKMKNLVCVEDFPNVFLRDPAVLHAMLRFNPIASGLLVKALSRILSIESASEGRKMQPLPTRETLQILAETSGGDIRSAVNALQFATKKNSSHLEGLFTGSSQTRKLTRHKSLNKAQPRKDVSIKCDNLDGFAAIGGKDASLFLFRALGKVLYCKRNQDCGVVEPLPKHLQLHERTPLLENPESIYDKTSMGAASFSVFLQQNCLAFFADIDSAAQALHHLTDSDVLAAEWTGREVLEDYAASVTIRGLMHANRGIVSSGGWRPFTRPQWYSVHKETRQNVLGLKDEYQISLLTLEELTTVMVPLKAKILTSEGRGHHSLTKTVGLFSQVQLRSIGERIGEQDIDVSITEDEEVRKVASRRDSHSYFQQELIANNQDDPEEDFRIDDYDDE
ncbi:cell cycle checkpoint protein RAD17-like isoform X2 [Cherax quadricarinatus]|uniref:cell cycle checkpoint protein RAD17-like isoform X2 n=1 Tax=Cherax quadricarinatus TaxID=27406 RepID=UPI00387E63D8